MAKTCIDCGCILPCKPYEHREGCSLIPTEWTIETVTFGIYALYQGGQFIAHFSETNADQHVAEIVLGMRKARLFDVLVERGWFVFRWDSQVIGETWMCSTIKNSREVGRGPTAIEAVENALKGAK